MHHPSGILFVNELIIFGIQRFQLLAEGFESLLFQPFFQLLPYMVFDGGYVVDAFAYGVDIHHAATAEQRELSLLPDELQHLAFEECCTVIAAEWQCSDKVVGNGCKSISRGSGCADAHLLENLPGVGIDNRDMEVHGKPFAEL